MKINPHFSRSSLTNTVRRMASLILTGAAIVAVLGLSTQKAYAHHPIIVATASCSNGAAVISYTVTSFDQYLIEGENPDVEVLFDGVVVDTGAFSTTPYGFMGMKPAPLATDTVIVEALAVGTWGDGFAGGEYSDPVTVTIPTNCAPGTGRFTGGGKLVTVNLVNGLVISVTKGFEVDCDLHQPSNNLEVNWEGNQFHMTAFTQATCTAPGVPNPPTAPVNKIVGVGTGRYDGVDGYTIEFTLVDNGEPGTKDQIALKVYETANPLNVVLDTGGLQLITSGNIQAHVDQH